MICARERALGEDLLGVVLAGGRSSRMGQDKALLELGNGTTLLEHQLLLLSPLVPQMALSVRDRDYAFLAGKLQTIGRVRLLRDVTQEVGPLGGIASALEEAARRHFAGILVLPCDMPLITGALLKRLLCLWRKNPRPLVSALQESSGRVHPLVAVWSTRALPHVRRALARGEYALRRAVEKGQWQTLRLEPCEDALVSNANTPKEWLAIQRALASGTCLRGKALPD